MSDRALHLTTPIYYVNALPHLGHASTTIMADAMCRYRRLLGERVYFLTGTDEHGDKIAQAAAAAGVSPQAYADDIAAGFRDTWRRLGITNDDFIRTTEPRHQAVVQAILQRLWDTGQIYFGEYGGNYCFGCERFYTDKEIVEGKCPDHQTPLTFIKETNYFFRMSQYQDWLIAHLEANPDFIQPERYKNEVLGFLREPLLDLSISRPKSRLAWGIPLPFDDQYVTYVWFDALLNYVSGLGYPDGELYRDLWAAGYAEHLIGKDILKPHGVYWPTMLKAAGLPLYRRLNVHGYWSLGGGKMSKSVGNVVEAFQLTDKYGHDAFRYFLLRELTFGLDASFSEDALVGRLNADLANDLGNLVSRATTMIVNFGGGRVPVSPPGIGHEMTEAVIGALAKSRQDVLEAMEHFAFQRALAAIWEFLAILNRCVDATQPWALAKDPGQRSLLDEVLHTLAQALNGAAVLLTPFVPEAAEKIRAAISARAEPTIDDVQWGSIPAGSPVIKLAGLFPRVDGKASAAASVAAQNEAAAPRIPLDDFAKVDLRVAEVVAAEKLPKSR